MKGVILAGGTGSRLQPLTRVTNKALLPVGRRPMILHVLEVLLRASIEDVMVITGPEHMGALVSLLGSGKEFGCRLTYRVQDEPNGIAAALAMCEDFVGDERFAVILGDNIFEDTQEAASFISAFAADRPRKKGVDTTPPELGLVVKQVSDPERFGVYYEAPNGFKRIVEKPKTPPSSDAVLGLYMYSPLVFSVIRSLVPSERGEYEISDVNDALLMDEGVVSEVYRLTSGWTDAGTHESLERANEMLLRRMGR